MVENQRSNHSWRPEPSFAVARQVPEQAIQRQCLKEVLGMDDQRPVQVYSSWKKEGAIKISCPSMGA